MVYRFRVILDNDSDDDVFRDLEIFETDTFEDLHNIINQSFGFDGAEMASFYVSDDTWNQGEEISLFDVSDSSNNVKLMNETIIKDIVHEAQTKLIYVYDFFNMWTFYVELADISEIEDGRSYPNVLFSFGEIPDTPPDKQFESDPSVDFDDSFESYEDLDFDENWN